MSELNRISNKEIDIAVHTEQVQDLYVSMGSAVMANIAASILLVAAQWSVFDATILLGWLFLSTSVLIARLFLLYFFKRQSDLTSNISLWSNLFDLGSSASGLVLGIAGVVLFPAGNEMHQLICAFVLVGMSAGAVSTLSVGRYTFPLYISLGLIPLTARLLIEGSQFTYILAPMIILVYIYVLKSSRRIYNNNSQNIKLRIEAINRESELFRTQQKQRLHFMNTPLAVIEWSADFNVAEWNPAAENIFGYSKTQIIGTYGPDLIIPDAVMPVINEVMQSLLTEHDSQEITIQNKTADGRIITCEWNNTPLIDSEGKVIAIISTARDITEKLKIENEILVAKEDAEKANNAKSEFLSRMSHELRTPLNAILGFSQILRINDANLTDNQSESIDYIYTSGQHLLNLINEVLEISRIDAGAMKLQVERLELGHLITETIDLLKPITLDKQISVEYTSVDDIHIQTDKTRLKQVLINLISNSIKYNKNNGKVFINAQLNLQGKVIIQIRDTGIGIKQKHQASIFDAFTRINESGNEIEGTGIGLTVTLKLLELMKSTIRLESEFGNGSTFEIEMPRDLDV